MANLAQIIPALFVKDGELLTPEQIKRRQALSANALAFATDTSPNAGGVASILAKGLAGFRSGWEEKRANSALAAAGKENQSLISSLLGGLGSAGGVGQSATVASPTVSSQSVANVIPSPNRVEPQFANDGTELGAILSDAKLRASLPAGMRNNNPGNIKFVGQKVPGIVGPSVNTDQGDPQAVFDTPESGMKAMYSLLLKKYTGGKKSPNQMIAGNMGWTPGNYDAAANVARTMGISPDDDIGLDNPTRASRFMQALILQEHGQKGKLYSQDMIQNAIGGGASSPAPQQQYRDPVVSSQPSTGVNPAIIAALSNPVANEQTRSVASLLLNNQLSQQQAAQELALKQQQQQQAIAQRQSIAQSMGINPSAALDENAWKAAVEAANRGRQTATVNGVVLDVNTGEPIFQAPQQPTTGMQDYNFYAESERQAGRQPLGPLEYEQALRSAGASRTNIDTGTVPQGYQAIRDEQGRLIRYDPVPGGPADTTKTQEKAQANTQRSSNIVLEDVDRAVSAIESNPALTTGIIGNWSRSIGGTPANKVQNLLQTVRANSAFDRLQQMREASPTGGALGAVSDSELGLLQNAIGSLEQSNNSEDLVYNLRRVQRIYEDIINGPDAAKKMREERTKAGESASQPAQGWKDLGNGIKIRPKGSN